MWAGRDAVTATRDMVQQEEHGPSAIDPEKQLLLDLDGINVYEWMPGPVGANVAATQVHMGIKLKNSYELIARFKGPDTLDFVITALIKHRRSVFGPADFDRDPRSGG